MAEPKKTGNAQIIWFTIVLPIHKLPLWDVRCARFYDTPVCHLKVLVCKRAWVVSLPLYAENNHGRVRDKTSPLQTLLKCLVANCSTAKELSAKPLLTPLVNLGSKSDHSYDQMAGLQWLERSGAPQRARPWPQSEGPQVLNALTSWRSSPVPFFMYCSGTAPTHPEGLAVGYSMICVHAVLGPEVSRKSWL